MLIDIKIPSPGESITEVELGKWLVEDGAIVDKDDEIAEVESDKATLTLVVDKGGQISFKVAEGDLVPVGTIVCTIDTSKTDEETPNSNIDEAESEPTDFNSIPENNKSEAINEPERNIKTTPVAQKMLQENNLSVEDIINGLQRIGKKEVELVLQASANLPTANSNEETKERKEEHQKMSPLRRKLSQRLVAVKNETAMLTTFNEVNMKPIMELRQKYQESFAQKHGFKIGFMSFFTKASAIAMQYHPTINAMIDGDEIINHNYVDIGIAVQTPKGLMVPIVRNAETKSIPTIEQEIKELASKARDKKITIEELSGGTFTITNGGTFGSLLSTPIINPPQSAILGMHNIVERPVAINGEVVIRPMMYIALSYDHRLIDGKDSVGFLVRVKDLLENPQKMLTEGQEFEKLLLEI